MAEGGFDEFENPTFDRDDYDDDGIDRDEAETSFTDEAQFQRTLKNQFDAIKDLTVVERENQLKEEGTSLIQTFYFMIEIKKLSLEWKVWVLERVIQAD